jgi:hypothetical protein
VLLGAEDYARRRRYEQKALHVSELPAQVVEELRKVDLPRADCELEVQIELGIRESLGLFCVMERMVSRPL